MFSSTVLAKFALVDPFTLAYYAKIHCSFWNVVTILCQCMFMPANAISFCQVMLCFCLMIRSLLDHLLTIRPLIARCYLLNHHLIVALVRCVSIKYCNSHTSAFTNSTLFRNNNTNFFVSLTHSILVLYVTPTAHSLHTSFYPLDIWTLLQFPHGVIVHSDILRPVTTLHLLHLKTIEILQVIRLSFAHH